MIDAHVHIGDFAEQAWTEPFPALRRSFQPADLAQLAVRHGVDGFVVVQAGDTLQESLDLLQIAAAEELVIGVVGWADLTSPELGAQLATLRGADVAGRLVGLRHQLQSEPDRRWITRPEVRRGLSTMAAEQLVYDIVVSSEQLPGVIAVVAALPELRFVLDHAGKPPIAAGELSDWRSAISALSQLPNIVVKLSGLITEADFENWTQAELDPVISFVLDSFGAERTMAGSDWPVCLLAGDYGTVQGTLEPGLAGLQEHERAALLGGTAMRWYGIAER